MKTLLALVVALVFLQAPAFAYDDEEEREASSVSLTQDPVQRFPDEKPQYVDEYGNWLNPEPPPAVEAAPEPVTINEYRGVGN